MKIRMLQTVEDSHKHVLFDDDGNPSIAYDVRRFEAGSEYDQESGGPDWDRRAAGLINLGYAERI